jgi:hypothetical protein
MASAAEHGLGLDEFDASAPPTIDELDDLDLDEETWRAGRLSWPVGAMRLPALFDQAHHEPPPYHRSAGPPRGPGGLVWGGITWLILVNSLAALACGASLLGWSVLGNRPELWDFGLPVAIVGQAGLLFSLALQLERLAHSNREAASRLSEVDEHLHALRQTAHSLANHPHTTHVSAAEHTPPHAAVR